jgi:hypothetical protein
MKDMREAQSSPVLDESVVCRPARALLGWVSQQEAATLLLGRNPTPNDDTSSLVETAKKHAEAVASRSSYEPADARTPSSDFEDALTEVAKRPSVQATFHNLSWQTAVVDLTKVLSFQKLVFTDQWQNDATPNRTNLVEICLPSEQAAPPMGAFSDPDGKGFTISSLNPNLRIVGSQLNEANVAPGPGQPSMRMQAVTLLVSMGTSYLQVIEYRGRCFLRDGYHRAARLLRAGLTTVPCIYIQARSFEEFQMPSGSLSYEILYGEHPPALTDFWDDDVSSEISQLAIRKVVRIRGDELVVPR